MLSEGLNYRQVRNEDGTYAFILEPPLETLASFPLARDMGDVEGSSRPKCTSSTAMVGRNSNLNGIRQMIASEVELERIRRCGRGRSEPESAPSILGRRAELQKAYADMIRMKGQTGGNKGGGSITGNTRSVTKKDFFGRPIPPSAHDVTVGDQDRDQSSEERPMAGRQFQPVRDRVWFRFNEGFTNAVRRPMRIRDLFTNLDKT